MKWWPFRRRELAPKEPDNIRAFNAMTVHVLGKLYGSFPTPIDIDSLRETLEITYEGLVKEPPVSEAEKHFSSCFPDTVRWLEQSGFVRVGGGDLGGKFHGVVLTE